MIAWWLSTGLQSAAKSTKEILTLRLKRNGKVCSSQNYERCGGPTSDDNGDNVQLWRDIATCILGSPSGLKTRSDGEDGKQINLP